MLWAIIFTDLIFRGEKYPVPSDFPMPPELSEMMRAFKSEIDSINESVRLLEGFSNDYFMTLNESGYRELCDILEALWTAFALCKKLVEENKIREAQEILSYLYRNKGKGNPPAVLNTYLARSAPLFVSWPERIQGRIELIEKNIKNASKQFQAVGTVRKRMRSPTTVILGDVRKSILGKLVDKKKTGF